MNGTFEQRNNLTEGVVWKKLMRFFFPIFFGMLFEQLYNTADAVIVGRWVGDAALAAVGGTASVIINLLIGVFFGLSTGATVLIAQKAGAKEADGLSRILHTAVIFCFAAGIFITLFGYFITPWAMRFLGTPEDIMSDSVQYLRIFLTGATPLLIYTLVQGTLQGVGDSRRPLMYLMLSCLLNIVLDLLFVAVFHWGIPGAAWASVISIGVCAVLATTHLIRVEGAHRLEFSRLRIHPPYLKKMLRVGIPSGLQNSMYSVSNMVVQSAVNSFGTVTVTAWTSIGKLDGFYWVTSNAFGVALCAFVGQCYGAGKIGRMKKAVKTCLFLSLGVTVCFSTMFLTIAKPVYSLFLSNAEVIQRAIDVMWCCVPFYFLWTLIEILSATFRGVGDTLKPAIIVLLGTCLFRILWVIFVLPRWHTFACIGWLYTVSWGITALANIVYYFKGRWMRCGES